MENRGAFLPRPNLTKAQADWFGNLCPQAPYPKQQELLDCTAREVLIAGGGRSGKTSGALMRMLKYADIPGYSAICLRRNYAQMIKADAIMARAIEWWRGRPGVKWDAQNHMFYFSCPGGGVSQIGFGHMESALSFYDYQGSVAHAVFFDELTHFDRQQYMYLFSRQSKPAISPLASKTRTLSLADIPLFIGGSANPGGVGHAWVKERFIDAETRNPRAVWIPANVEDNPSIDLASYEASLEELDPVTRAQLRHGSWDELEPGDFFDSSNFVYIDAPPPRLDSLVRFWDLASSEAKKGKDPDATASCLMGFLNIVGPPGTGIQDEQQVYVLDVTEDRWSAGDVPQRMSVQAAQDTTIVAVRWEQEGGSSGAIVSESAIKPLLRGYDADGIRSTGSKLDRARPFAGKAAQRKVFVVKREWTKKWSDQLHRFPAVDHDDMVDATSGAYNYLQSRAIGAPRITRANVGVTANWGDRRKIARKDRW